MEDGGVGSDMDDANGNDMGGVDMNDVDGAEDDGGMGVDMDDQGMDDQGDADGQEEGDADPEGEHFDYEQMDLRICGDLSKYYRFDWLIISIIVSVEKNKKLDEMCMSQNLDGQIQVRIEQLAVCKILVNIHRKDLFILVRAYTQLGEAYLNNKYYEQALDHLTTALKLNGSLFQKHEETK